MQPRPEDLPIGDVVHRIVLLTEGLRRFWSDPHGWAPLAAAQLLSRSRLDWQVSLSRCLSLWTEEPATADASGQLILGWANLGSLVEGSMKLFLSAWYETYRRDEDYAIVRRGQTQDPDGLMLEAMRQYYRKRIWDETWDEWVQHIQARRNAIHAFRDRDLGTREELLHDIRMYLSFLRYVNARLPYPGDEYMPSEVGSA